MFNNISLCLRLLTLFLLIILLFSCSTVKPINTKIIKQKTHNNENHKNKNKENKVKKLKNSNTDKSYNLTHIKQAEPTKENKKVDRKKMMEELKNILAKQIKERIEMEKRIRAEESSESVDQEANQEDLETLKPNMKSKPPKTKEERKAIKKAEKRLYQDLTGLVIDNTISPFGSQFYNKFYLRWDPPTIKKDYNIYIEEKTNPSFGFIIIIKVDEYIVWQKRLKPRLSEIESAVINSIKNIKAFLESYEENLKQLSQYDLRGNGL